LEAGSHLPRMIEVIAVLSRFGLWSVSVHHKLPFSAFISDEPNAQNGYGTEYTGGSIVLEYGIKVLW